jgi:hypothetical protein
VAFSVPAIANATGYTWTLPTGASIASGSNTNSITVNFSTTASSGNITVRGTNACGNGTISANYSVTVNPLPAAAGTITGTATVCQGQSGVSFAVPAISDATSYSWSYSGTGFTASGNTPSIFGSFSSSATSGNVWSNNATTATITVNATGNYSVTVTDANGCSSVSTPISVNVSNAPAPTISATSTQACSGDVVTVTSSAADSYLWSTGETTQSIQVTNTAAVYVTVTNANACDGVGQSSTSNITFTATPTAAGSFTTAGNVVTFTNTSTGATSYSWDFGDFTNSSASAPAHAFAGNGAYTVVLTAINGNCTDTVAFEISIEVGIEENNSLTFEVYPNPASAQVFVAFENNDNATLTVLDAMGRVVLTQAINEVGSLVLPVSVAELASGSYTMQIISENQVGVKRLMIRK